MIVITLNFTAIEVSKFARNEPMILKVFFNDGKDRFLEKSTNLENVEEFTQQVINEARKLAKESNAKSSGGFLDDVVMVRFGEDEEKLEEKMINAFRRVKEDMKRLKTINTPQNYLQKLAMFQKSKYNI